MKWYNPMTWFKKPNWKKTFADNPAMVRCDATNGKGACRCQKEAGHPGAHVAFVTKAWN